MENEEKIQLVRGNPLASTIMEECELGLIALWTIESIRIGELKGDEDKLSARFPSLLPVLIDNNGNNQSLSKSEAWLSAAKAYRHWWYLYKDSSEIMTINPLENTDLRW